MEMFKNYENNSYPAYNLTSPEVSKSVQKYLSSPIIGYNRYNNIVCFMWDPMDEFTLNLSIGFKINVFNNSIIYNSIGDKPTSTTNGIKGQRAYNVVEGKSWVCKGLTSEFTTPDQWIPIVSEEKTGPEWVPLNIFNIKVFNMNTDALNEQITTDNEYLWELDNILTFPINGDKEITICPNMQNKTLQVTFMNFRHEVIYTYEFKNTNNCSIQINQKDTPLLVEGQFFINLYIKDETTVTQQIQYPITIMENPNKYIAIPTNKELYIFSKTIQEESNEIFSWIPITSQENEYVWIPIQSSIFSKVEGDN